MLTNLRSRFDLTVIYVDEPIYVPPTPMDMLVDEPETPYHGDRDGFSGDTSMPTPATTSFTRPSCTPVWTRRISPQQPSKWSRPRRSQSRRLCMRRRSSSSAMPPTTSRSRRTRRDQVECNLKSKSSNTVCLGRKVFLDHLFACLSIINKQITVVTCYPSARREWRVYLASWAKHLHRQKLHRTRSMMSRQRPVLRLPPWWARIRTNC